MVANGDCWNNTILSQTTCPAFKQRMEAMFSVVLLESNKTTDLCGKTLKVSFTARNSHHCTDLIMHMKTELELQRQG